MFTYLRFSYRIFVASLVLIYAIRTEVSVAGGAGGDQNPPRNLTTSVSGNTVTLNWQQPDSSGGEGTVGSDGGRVSSENGDIDFIIPPGTFDSLTRVRVTSIPIQEFHDEVVGRGIDPVGEPLDKASVIEIETERMNLPTILEITTPTGVSLTDEIIFSQLLPDRLRFLGIGTFSEDGSRIRTTIPINVEQGLPGSSISGITLARVSQFNFLGEVQGNGIDDDGDGLIDEMEIYEYPDRVMRTGTCQITGAITFSNGAPAVGAIVSMIGPGAVPLVDIADEFGRYLLAVFFTGSTVSSSYTVTATDPATGQIGTATGSCMAGGGAVTNVTIDTNAPPGVVVNISSPADSATLMTNVPTIIGTVNDPNITEIEILVNGGYPPVKGVVTNGSFSVQVFLGFSANSIVALARNQVGQAGVHAITVFVPGNTQDPPDILVSLQWDKDNDLDVYLVTPAGNLIWWETVGQIIDGGSLNIDQTSGTSSGPEVISFPAGAAQPGRYGIAVHFYSDDDLGATSAVLSIAVRGRTLGTFQNVLAVSDPLEMSPATLADLNPASVWNVTSVDLPAGVTAPTRPLSEFVFQAGGSIAFGRSSIDMRRKLSGLSKTFSPMESQQAPTFDLVVADFDFGGSSLGFQQVLQSFNIYRSTSPNARNTGTIRANVGANTTTFTDSDLPAGTFFYQVTAVYDQGESIPSNEASLLVTSVESTPGNIPDGFGLSQNYPNPFNPETNISYTIPQGNAPTQVTLAIYDLSGKKIHTLVNERQASGSYQIRWDGRNDAGHTVASGLYVYRLQAGEFGESRKMVLLK